MFVLQLFLLLSLAFVCHEQGSTCIGFAPQHQVIVTGGRKGDICIFDVRGGSGSIKHRYLGHDSCLKCMTIDPHEQFYCTGAADGDIKVNSRALHPLSSQRKMFIIVFFSDLEFIHPSVDVHIPRRTRSF
jgi:WD40 repeat protein